MKVAVATVDEYLAEIPEPARSTLDQLRKTIRAAAPQGTTEAISYGMPAFKYQGAGLMGFAAFAKHCSLFPMSAGIVPLFAEELKAYKTSKGTIQFPSDKPLPATLVRKLVNARLAEVEGKKKR